MTALDKKINQLAARHRWNVTPVHDRFIPCYSIIPMDRQERSRLEWSIVNAYSEAYHFNGHDSAAAKLAAQHKAAEIGALDLFRQMYRTA